MAIIFYNPETKKRLSVHEIDAPAWRKLSEWEEVGPTFQKRKTQTVKDLQHPEPKNGAFAKTEDPKKPAPKRKTKDPKED